MKKIFALAAALSVALSCLAPSALGAAEAPSIDVPSYILIEKETGTILCEENSHEKLAPASVTKIMTLLLIMEAMERGELSLDDTITASTYASKMGGSQIYLREGEQMRAEDMLKSVIIASANDAAVALAEHISGSEDTFVSKMNARALELGMSDTTFKNCTGLPEEGHVTTAYDISLMSAELLSHETIKKYSTTWMDSVRNGEFGLTNTNRLVRFYEGATGLKTGYTSEALHCLSASAERDGMELIAVVMRAPTSDIRFESAKTLLSYGFANYALVPVQPDGVLPPVEVTLGERSDVAVTLSGGKNLLVEKSIINDISRELTLLEEVEAPVQKGQKLGELKFTAAGAELATIDIVAAEDVAKLAWYDIFARLLKGLFSR